MKHHIFTILSVLLGLGCLFTFTPNSWADEVAGFTGFTRPGSPEDRGEITAVSNEHIRNNGVGASVYFTVLENTGDPNDPWGTGLQQFPFSFEPGINFGGTPSPSLDTSAKYLYLYQVVNDRRTLSPIHGVSVKLIVELDEITSWGHFNGVGFASKERDNTDVLKPVRIQPVSYSHVIAGLGAAARYKQKAPPKVNENPFRLIRIPTKRGQKQLKEEGKGIVAVHWDPLDPAIVPDFAMLLEKSEFKDHPCFRVVFHENNGISKEGRSTAFGFTSNLPPKFEPTKIRGLRVEVKGGDILPVANVPLTDDPKDDGISLIAEGTVPTPVPKNPIVPTDTEAPLLPTGTGLTSSETLPSGGSVSPFGSLPFSGFVTGGEPSNGGGGAGNGNGNGDLLGQQQQEQEQQQQQQQQQKTGQKPPKDGPPSNGPPSEVVPTPAAFLLALLGLPVLYFVRRRSERGDKVTR